MTDTPPPTKQGKPEETAKTGRFAPTAPVREVKLGATPKTELEDINAERLEAAQKRAGVIMQDFKGASEAEVDEALSEVGREYDRQLLRFIDWSQGSGVGGDWPKRHPDGTIEFKDGSKRRPPGGYDPPEFINPDTILPIESPSDALDARREHYLYADSDMWRVQQGLPTRMEAMQSGGTTPLVLSPWEQKEFQEWAPYIHEMVAGGLFEPEELMTATYAQKDYEVPLGAVGPEMPIGPPTDWVPDPSKWMTTTKAKIWMWGRQNFKLAARYGSTDPGFWDHVDSGYQDMAQLMTDLARVVGHGTADLAVGTENVTRAAADWAINYNQSWYPQFVQDSVKFRRKTWDERGLDFPSMVAATHEMVKEGRLVPNAAWQEEWQRRHDAIKEADKLNEAQRLIADEDRTVFEGFRHVFRGTGHAAQFVYGGPMRLAMATERTLGKVGAHWLAQATSKIAKNAGIEDKVLAKWMQQGTLLGAIPHRLANEPEIAVKMTQLMTKALPMGTKSVGMGAQAFLKSGGDMHEAGMMALMTPGFVMMSRLADKFGDRFLQNVHHLPKNAITGALEGTGFTFFDYMTYADLIKAYGEGDYKGVKEAALTLMGSAAGWATVKTAGGAGVMKQFRQMRTPSGDWSRSVPLERAIETGKAAVKEAYETVLKPGQERGEVDWGGGKRPEAKVDHTISRLEKEIESATPEDRVRLEKSLKLAKDEQASLDKHWEKDKPRRASAEMQAAYKEARTSQGAELGPKRGFLHSVETKADKDFVDSLVDVYDSKTGEHVGFAQKSEVEGRTPIKDKKGNVLGYETAKGPGQALKGGGEEPSDAYPSPGEDFGLLGRPSPQPLREGKVLQFPGKEKPADPWQEQAFEKLNVPYEHQRTVLEDAVTSGWQPKQKGEDYRFTFGTRSFELSRGTFGVKMTVDKRLAKEMGWERTTFEAEEAWDSIDALTRSATHSSMRMKSKEIIDPAWEMSHDPNTLFHPEHGYYTERHGQGYRKSLEKGSKWRKSDQEPDELKVGEHRTPLTEWLTDQLTNQHLRPGGELDDPIRIATAQEALKRVTNPRTLSQEQRLALEDPAFQDVLANRPREGVDVLGKILAGELDPQNAVRDFVSKHQARSEKELEEAERLEVDEKSIEENLQVWEEFERQLKEQQKSEEEWESRDSSEMPPPGEPPSGGKGGRGGGKEPPGEPPGEGHEGGSEYAAAKSKADEVAGGGWNKVRRFLTGESDKPTETVLRDLSEEMHNQIEAKEVEHQRFFENVEKRFGRKLANNLDLISYMQQTGNHLKSTPEKRDTIEDVIDRLNQLGEKGREAMEWMDKVARPLQRMMGMEQVGRGQMAEENLQEHYLTQIWDFPDTDTARKTIQRYQTKHLQQKSQFTRKKKIGSYQEGMEQGLVPKTTNLAEIMKIYANVWAKTKAHHEFLTKAKEIELPTSPDLMTKDGKPLRLIMAGPRAKKAGYVGVAHPVLQYTFKGTDKILQFGIHPDAEAQFRRDMITRQRGGLEKKIVAAGSLAKQAALSMSGFHFFALAESAYMFGGSKATWNKDHPISSLVNWMVNANPITQVPLAYARGYQLNKDIAKVTGAIREGGLQIGRTRDIEHGVIYETLDGVIKRTQLTGEESWLQAKGMPKAMVNWMAKSVKAIKRWNDTALWDWTHSYFKLDAYHNLVDKLSKTKKPQTAEELAAIKKSAGQMVNDAFGGQNWHTFHRTSSGALQFGQATMLSIDWTLSNLRIAGRGVASFTAEPLHKAATGKEMSLSAGAARSYAVRAGVMFAGWATALQQAILRTALDDEKVGDDGLTDKQRYLRDHGDFNIWNNTPGKRAFTICIGYDENGREKYMGVGKQVRETLGWLPSDENQWDIAQGFEVLYGKAAPLVRQVIEQGSGHDSLGRPLPWKEPGGNSAMERAAHFFAMFAPFSSRGMLDALDKGSLEKMQTVMFSFPRKGLTEWGATKFVQDAVSAYAEGEAHFGYVENLVSLAASNRFKPGMVLSKALERAREPLWKEFKHHAINEDWDEVRATGAKLLRLTANLDSAKSSLTRWYQKLRDTGDLPDHITDKLWVEKVLAEPNFVSRRIMEEKNALANYAKLLRDQTDPLMEDRQEARRLQQVEKTEKSK